MIKIGPKDVSAIRIGNKVIVSVYKGATLIWQSIKTCFNLGYWVNKCPWKNDGAWKN